MKMFSSKALNVINHIIIITVKESLAIAIVVTIHRSIILRIW